MESKYDRFDTTTEEEKFFNNHKDGFLMPDLSEGRTSTRAFDVKEEEGGFGLTSHSYKVFYNNNSIDPVTDTSIARIYGSDPFNGYGVVQNGEGLAKLIPSDSPLVPSEVLSPEAIKQVVKDRVENALANRSRVIKRVLEEAKVQLIAGHNDNPHAIRVSFDTFKRLDLSKKKHIPDEVDQPLKTTLQHNDSMIRKEYRTFTESDTQHLARRNRIEFTRSALEIMWEKMAKTINYYLRKDFQGRYEVDSSSANKFFENSVEENVAFKFDIKRKPEQEDGENK